MFPKTQTEARLELVQIIGFLKDSMELRHHLSVNPFAQEWDIWDMLKISGKSQME